MEELNQIQNPNVPTDLSAQGAMPQQMPSMPPMSYIPAKKKSHWFLITVFALVAGGAFAWWYIDQMGEELLVLDGPSINKEAREDIETSKELEGVDTGNLDAEFQPIDSDTNSL